VVISLIVLFVEKEDIEKKMYASDTAVTTSILHFLYGYNNFYDHPLKCG